MRTISGGRLKLEKLDPINVTFFETHTREGLIEAVDRASAHPPVQRFPSLARRIAGRVLRHP
jgi:hypothetical protein